MTRRRGDRRGLGEGEALSLARSQGRGNKTQPPIPKTHASVCDLPLPTLQVEVLHRTV